MYRKYWKIDWFYCCHLQGEAAVAVVNQNGVLVEPPGVAASSFGWGVTEALKGNPDKRGKLDFYETFFKNRTRRNS